MARYYPPRSISIPFRVLVQRKDPDWERDRRNEIEFEFSNGRVFRQNPAIRGPYEPEE